MNQDLSELVAYLDKKFEETAKKSDLNNLATSSELEIIKKENEQEHTELKEAINTLTNSIDRLTKQIEILTDE